MSNDGKLCFDKMPRVFVVAEVGSNHGGNIERAKQYVQAAALAGADAVKFQTIHPRQFWAGEDRRRNMERCFPQTGDKWWRVLVDYGLDWGIIVFSTPFDVGSIDLLIKAGVRLLKIASGDLNYTELLTIAGDSGLPVILSTGMATLEEVDQAVNILLRTGCQQYALLHCVSEYPARPQDMNLRCLPTLRDRYHGVPVGLSDHSDPANGDTVALGAVAVGAQIIERHIVHVRTSTGGDHVAAMTLPQFSGMVEKIRLLEAALGTGVKQPTEVELGRQSDVRRGWYAARDLQPGVIAPGDFLALRPWGTGVFVGYAIVGRILKIGLKKGEQLEWQHL